MACGKTDVPTSLRFRYQVELMIECKSYEKKKKTISVLFKKIKIFLFSGILLFLLQNIS